MASEAQEDRGEEGRDRRRFARLLEAALQRIEDALELAHDRVVVDEAPDRAGLVADGAGHVEGGLEAGATAVSADGQAVVGNAADVSGARMAFRWTPSGGMQQLGTLGGNSSGADGVSGDGTVVVGSGPNGSSQIHAFRLELGQLGATYCANAITNSAGCYGVIDARGSSVAALNSVTLVGRRLPANAFGFFLTSRDQGNTYPVNNSQGRLCLSGFIGRYVGPGQIKNSGTSGSFSLAIDLTSMPQPFGNVAAQPGDTWNFQAWYRDANPMSTSNLTDAVSVMFH